jgi:hypothetical protein
MNQEEFEKSLRKGDAVRVRWRKASGRGVIEKVNHASFTVCLTATVSGYPAGSTIRVARVCGGRWSASNCVRPKEE